MKTILLLICCCYLISIASQDYLYAQDKNLVIKVQQVLIEQGYFNGSINGKYDSNTQSSVKAFQNKNGLKVTGKLDSKTIDKICKDFLPDWLNGAWYAKFMPADRMYPSTNKWELHVRGKYLIIDSKSADNVHYYKDYFLVFDHNGSNYVFIIKNHSLLSGTARAIGMERGELIVGSPWANIQLTKTPIETQDQDWKWNYLDKPLKFNSNKDIVE